MFTPEVIDTIPYKPEYYGPDDDFIPDSLKTLAIDVIKEEDDQFVSLSVYCGDERLMVMMHVCAAHAHCLIDGFLAGFERGYAKGVDDIAEEDIARSQKNHANQ